MSAFGTKRTLACALHMSAFGSSGDITPCVNATRIVECVHDLNLRSSRSVRSIRAFEGATLYLYRDVVCLSDQMRISAAGPARDWSDVGRGWRED